jgi:hypothetical protein
MTIPSRRKVRSVISAKKNPALHEALKDQHLIRRFLPDGRPLRLAGYAPRGSNQTDSPVRSNHQPLLF